MSATSCLSVLRLFEPLGSSAIGLTVIIRVTVSFSNRVAKALIPCSPKEFQLDVYLTIGCINGLNKPGTSVFSIFINATRGSSREKSGSCNSTTAV